ncbi:MAG TPA: carboxypeptidase-like regulatory domain-containing protein [Pyrinomonadaceae bacterium]|jgi:protocatechuate 3,4-dioxygenase beta subunit|nr:carboxypeptidase-like regulatory domain-containing protein [Pyrinomonadaceae bacterium]
MKHMGARHAAVFIFMVHILASTTVAQQIGGTITGRVMTEDGQPIPHAIVSIFGVSGRTNQTTVTRETTTNDNGEFVADGLESIPYVISAWSPGYVPATQGTVLNPFELSEQLFIHVGERVTVRLNRGGVITGRVTNDAREAVIGIPVKAIRIRDETERLIITDATSAHLWTRTTDDRGVYRIYGLAPGSYIVAAGGRDASSGRPSPFAGRVTTYHPSSTRDAATVVEVSSGIESTGIDIRYRGERGFAVSGKINVASVTNPRVTQAPLMIVLRSPTNGETIDTISQPIKNQNSYAFYGVPNGDYEVIASNADMHIQAPRRFTVKDADVTGVDLALLPNATISGLVAVAKANSEALECKNQRELHLEDIIVRFRRDESEEKRGDLLPIFPGYGVGIPDDKGVFTLSDLKPGRHRIELQLPAETWYVKALTVADLKPTIDPRNGLTVKSGDRLSGLRITIAEGAATLKGQVTLAEQTKLPTRLHVHLIPAEADALEDILRFAETNVDANGAFTVTNLAPGKYFLLARAIPGLASADKLMRPVAWDPSERKKLRKEAEAANLAIELKSCQQITGYELRLTK